MKHQVFILIFFVLLLMPLIYSASTDPQTKNRQYQIGLQLLETIEFSGTEHLLNITYEQEDLNAFIARHLVLQGLVISMEPNEKLAEKATLDYSGINNLHIVHMDALYFDFRKSLDIIIAIFPNDWLEKNKSIKKVIQSITQSLKSDGALYLCLDNNYASKRALITEALMNSNEYSHVCYQQNNQEKIYVITAQKK